MAFAKLSGSLLESDARPARAPEQPPVPAPPRAEERVAPVVDSRDTLERLARLAEAAPCYDSLWEFIRSGDEEGVARVVAELVRAGRSVSEISEVVESLSGLIESAGPDPSEKFAGELPRPGAIPEVAEAPPDPGPDEMLGPEIIRADEEDRIAAEIPREPHDPVAASWADPDPAPEPPIGTSPDAEYDGAIWHQPAESTAEPVIAGDAEPWSAGGRIRELVATVSPANRARPPLSPRAYFGAALAVVAAIAGGSLFLLSQPAVKEVGAATARPADVGATLVAKAAETGAGGVGQPAAGAPAAYSKAARLPELAMAAPVSPPTPAPPAVATPVSAAARPASAAPLIASPAVKPTETAPIPAETAASPAAPASAATAPAASSRPTALAGPIGGGGDRPEAKPPAAEVEASVKAATVAPAQPDQPVPAASIAAPTPQDRAESIRPEASAVVASLESAKAVPAARPPSSPAPPTGTAVPAAVEPKDPPATPVDTGPLLERGDRLFGTGEVASARLFYERAAESGDGQAALRLGETYDPAFLQRAQLRVAGDRGLAVFWYGRARELGADEADILLKGMQSR